MDVWPHVGNDLRAIGKRNRARYFKFAALFARAKSAARLNLEIKRPPRSADPRTVIDDILAGDCIIHEKSAFVNATVTRDIARTIQREDALLLLAETNPEVRRILGGRIRHHSRKTGIDKRVAVPHIDGCLILAGTARRDVQVDIIV